MTNHDLPDDENEISIEAGSLVECLRLIVDSIRHQRGEPSLAEEVAALMLQQETHENLPPVHFGPDAGCRCGSRAPLIVERRVMLKFPWNGTPLNISPNAFEKWQWLQPGEIGRCPDCGLWYQLTA